MALQDETPQKAQKGHFERFFCKTTYLRNPAPTSFFPPKTARKGCVSASLPEVPPRTTRKAA